MVIEIHVLQNFAPSNLNRDDTGSPKDCEFGGYRRARISSQCIKRRVRWHEAFRGLTKLTFAKRSNMHARQIAEMLAAAPHNKPFDQAYEVARYMFHRMGFKDKNERLTVMLLLGADEIERIAGAAGENWDLLAPLSNASLRWEQLAKRLAAALADLGEDADMLARLIANHKAEKADASALEKWLQLPDETWIPALTAVRAMPVEFRDQLREKYAAGSDDGDADEEEEGGYVPEAAAKLFKSTGKNKEVVEKLKAIAIDRDREKGADDRTGKDLAAKLKKIFNPLKRLKTEAVDVAMFGRMIAEIKDGAMTVYAACQVAHAISTHRIAMEADYFTAVEELKEIAEKQGVGQDAGAGMIGSVEFNSACYYRYAAIDIGQLIRNLRGEREVAKKAAEGFLAAFVHAIPTGKQNSFAAHSKPSLVFAVVRDGSPVSLANAFVKPIAPRDGESLVEKSIQAMDDYYGRLVGMYGDGGLKKSAVCQMDGVALKHLKDDVGSVEKLIETVVAAAFPAGGAA